MRAQQRTSALRRIGQNPFSVQYATMDWQFVSALGTEIRWAIIEQDGTPAMSLDGYSLNGIPQMWDATNLQFPNAATIDGAELVLTYPVALVAFTPFSLRANDPAFRGKFGEYLCAKALQLGFPAAPANTVVLDAVVSGTGADLNLDSIGDQAYGRMPSSIANTTNSEFALSAVITGSVMHVEFATPVTLGDVIALAATSNEVLNDTGGALDAFSEVVV